MSHPPYIDIHTHAQRMDADTLSILDIPLSQWSETHSHSSTRPFSISLHPSSQSFDQIGLLIKWIESHRHLPHWLAIGEVGFDPISPLSTEQQLDHFRAIAQLAEQEKKFVIVHCVRSYPYLRLIYDEIQPRQTWILHGFRKNSQTMQQWLLPNIAFGIGLHQPEHLIDDLPLERIFLETDHQTQQPIREIYQRLALRKNLTLEQLKRQIEKNYNRITLKN